jgi:hypothetical protein
MFVGDEVLLDVGFTVARARLANLARSGMLRGASEDAYGIGIVGLPGAAAPGRAGLARVQVRELAESDDFAGLAIRWEVTGPGGGLFPVLDADIKLTPVADRTTVLTLAGVYRPPAADGAPERAILSRAASAAVRNLLGRLAAGITGQPGPAAAGAGTSPVPRSRETPQPPPTP